MKLLFPLLALLLLSAIAHADDNPNANGSGTFLVPSPHGGYNVIQAGGPPAAIPFFGHQGFAANVIAHEHDKKSFIIVPTVQDDGHGGKHTVYQKLTFNTPEDAAAYKAYLDQQSHRY